MWYDAFIVGILSVMTVRGAAKGAVWQMASLVSLLLAFTLAKSGSIVIAPVIPLSAPMNRWVAMIILYLLCSWVCFSFARKIKRRMEKTSFTEYDRHLGGVLGFSYGVMICLVITFFAVTLSDTSRKHVLEARSGIVAAWLMNQLDPVMPSGLNQLLQPYLKNLDPATVQEGDSETEKPDQDTELINTENTTAAESHQKTGTIADLLEPHEAVEYMGNMVLRGTANSSLRFPAEDSPSRIVYRWKVALDPVEEWSRSVITWNPTALQSLNRNSASDDVLFQTEGNVETHLENGLLSGWVLPDDGHFDPALIFEMDAELGEYRYLRCSGQGCVIGVPQMIPVASPWEASENIQLQCTSHSVGALEERSSLVSRSVLQRKQAKGVRVALGTPSNQPSEFLLDYIFLDQHETIGLAEFDHLDSVHTWELSGLSRPKVWNSAFTSRSMTSKPMLERRDLRIDANRFQHLEVRMKVPRGSEPQIFWTTDQSSQSETHQLTMPTAQDHDYHVYRIDLRDVEEWTGLVNSLRVMPVSEVGQSFSIDYIRVVAVDEESR